jgi:electron transfer flavoprotein beta subunit
MVCVKQVPDVTKVKINPETNTLLREGVPSILNPFDEFAVEEAVNIREKFGGCVTIITMGPPQAEEALRTCLAMGADKGILLCDPVLAGSDTWATSMALTALLKKHKYDLIICGLETTDSSTAQVGPEIAEKLGLPQITFVNKIVLDDTGQKGIFTRETDTGYQTMEGKLPLVVTLVKGINVPREPDPKLLGGKKVEKVTVKDLNLNNDNVGIDGSPTQVVEINAAKKRARAQMVIDSSLTAHERIKLIMKGGILDREGSTKLEGKTEKLAKKTGEFILEIISE